jgi:hypothetical protein
MQAKVVLLAHSFQRGSCDPSALVSGRPEGEVAVVVSAAALQLP